MLAVPKSSWMLTTAYEGHYDPCRNDVVEFKVAPSLDRDGVSEVVTQYVKENPTIAADYWKMFCEYMFPFNIHGELDIDGDGSNLPQLVQDKLLQSACTGEEFTSYDDLIELIPQIPVDQLNKMLFSCHSKCNGHHIIYCVLERKQPAAPVVDLT